MLEWRVGEATRRGGRDLSDRDLSAAVVDISRLVTASARLRKLDAPEPETGAQSPDSLDELLRRLTYPEGEKSGSEDGDARPVPGETPPRR